MDDVITFIIILSAHSALFLPLLPLTESFFYDLWVDAGHTHTHTQIDYWALTDPDKLHNASLSLQKNLLPTALMDD